MLHPQDTQPSAPRAADAAKPDPAVRPLGRRSGEGTFSIIEHLRVDLARKAAGSGLGTSAPSRGARS